jgi:hypothetical protein
MDGLPSLPDGAVLVYGLVVVNLLFTRIKDVSCTAQAYIRDSAAFYHYMNLLTVFAVIVIYSKFYPTPPLYVVGLTAAFYVLFVMLTRCDAKFLVLVVACIFVVFYLQACKNYLAGQGEGGGEDSRKKIRQYEAVQVDVSVASLALTVLGVVAYIGTKSVEFDEKTWNWTRFWLSTSECAGDGEPRDLSVLQQLACGFARLAFGTSCGR